MARENNNKKPLYYTINGTDGSGKSVVIEQLLKILDTSNLVVLREPGGTPKAERIRKAILAIEETERDHIFKELQKLNFYEKTAEYIQQAYQHHTAGNIGMMEVYLYAASRNETNIDVVQKSLEKNKMVFGSRSISCSMAYQGKARGIGMDIIWEVNRPVLQRLPDFEIFLDVPTDVTIERLANRTEKQDRLDLENREFHRLSREGYLEFYKTNPFKTHIIDASGTIEENTNSVLSILQSYNII